MILDNLLANCKNIDDNFINTVDKLEIDKLSAIAAMQDEELIKIEIENSSFVNTRSIQNGYAITTILEKGEFYDLAYRNSSTYRKNFFVYKDLIKYNYPLYYQSAVDMNSKNMMFLKNLFTLQYLFPVNLIKDFCLKILK